TLLRGGCLGTSPLHPTVALSVRTLELYRQTHRVCPKLSIQAQVRMLCHMHNVPYRSYLCHQFSEAFDIYLEILHRVDLRVNTVLKRDTSDWRLRNTCPACFYKLKDEPLLQFSFLCEMDGNNSLKRVDMSNRGQIERPDTRTFRTDYWLTPQQVDVFKDEVNNSVSVLYIPNDDAHGVVDDTDAWVDDDDAPPITMCQERWRNAGPEQRKRMFAMFAESGIFVVACRHGNILLACDMIRSGELSKYPLALVDKLMNVHGANIACGYDIGCVFSKTLASSSLGPRARDLNLRMVVGSFHGHAHNRVCQLDWHPHHVPGMGRADFEGCERIFASSNALASGVRYATTFHRHQAIEQHFTFWDEEKYAALSRYLSNHYRQALKIVEDHPARLKQIQSAHNISDNDFERYLKAEKTYLESLKAEPPADSLQFEYTSIRSMYGAIATATIATAMNKAVRKANSLAKRIDNAEAHAAFLEEQIELSGERWAVTSPEYVATKQKIAERNYRKALDELERLVVQRLFELSKLNMGNLIGYKLRTHIAKALTRRSEAIRKALARYNEEARRLSPPRPALSWKEIVEYSFLGEFDLLRHSRRDVRQEDWARPANREATIQYLELQRAHEELARLEVEIPRLRTRMVDERREYEAAISAIEHSDAPLAHELRIRWARRRLINELHESRLHWIVTLPTYKGARNTGVRLGSAAEPASDDVLTRESFAEPPDDVLEENEDALAEEVEALDIFIDNIVD
ncbi:hypothetical protein BC834DRAFT_833181, partial [Gloeopeniophorella convolvens]